MNYQSVIETAIKSKRAVYVKYTGDLSEREIHPHAIYESTAGKIDLWSIQVYNPAKPVDRNEVRVFTLKNLISARLGNTTFNADPGFSASSIKNCRHVILAVQR